MPALLPHLCWMTCLFHLDDHKVGEIEEESGGGGSTKGVVKSGQKARCYRGLSVLWGSKFQEGRSSLARQETAPLVATPDARVACGKEDLNQPKDSALQGYECGVHAS